MGSSLRRLMLLGALVGPFSAIGVGCERSNPNEISGDDGKVVIPANAPKSQREFYEQQKALSKTGKGRRAAR